MDADKINSVTEFRWPLRVYYEDTDAGGVVYYANYLKFMERARSEWLRAAGFEQDRLRAEDRIIFAVCRVVIDYLRPARFNDEIQVLVRLKTLGAASMEFVQEIVRPSDGETLCRGQVTVGCVGADTFRPCAIPKAIQSKIKGFVDNAD